MAFAHTRSSTLVGCGTLCLLAVARAGVAVLHAQSAPVVSVGCYVVVSK